LIPELRHLGYVEGQNLIVEWRYSEGKGERWPELARELGGLKVDALVVFTTPAALAAKKATSRSSSPPRSTQWGRVSLSVWQSRVGT
jgi:hypothetical protein